MERKFTESILGLRVENPAPLYLEEMVGEHQILTHPTTDPRGHYVTEILGPPGTIGPIHERYHDTLDEAMWGQKEVVEDVRANPEKYPLKKCWWWKED